MAAFVDLAVLPWPYILAFASLAVIYFLYRRRADAFEEIGFSSKEVALLCLGSVAGWAVNLPVMKLGNSYLAVNLGGALVPVFLAAWWLRKGKLNVGRAVVGTAIVSVIAYRIVEFQPATGIVAVYPYFFLPTLAALAFALILHVRDPLRSVPVAYTSGSIGALLGADVYNFPVIADHYRSSGESAIISIGGAGVFDMVFIAGTLAMALDLAVVVAVSRRRAPATSADPGEYPGPAYEVRNAERTWAAFLALRNPTPLERAVGAVALSNAALREGDYARATRFARHATDEALAGLRPSHSAPARGLLLLRDVGILSRVAARAKDPGAAGIVPVSRREAGEANDTAKVIIGTLSPQLEGRNRLEGL